MQPVTGTKNNLADRCEVGRTNFKLQSSRVFHSIFKIQHSSFPPSSNQSGDCPAQSASYKPKAKPQSLPRQRDIRRALIKADLVDTALRDSAFGKSEAIPQVVSEAKDNMVALPGQLFYSTQIPVCLWFISRDKSGGKPSTRPVGHPSPSGRRDGDEGRFALAPATAALFPEHLEDSPLGHIPKGWTAQRLPEAIEVNPRRTLKAGTIAPYLDMKNLPTQGHSAEEIVDREFSSGTKFQNGDTLLARITPCLENGKTGYVDFLEDGQVGWGSTEYIVLSPKPPLPPQFAYLLARSDALRTHAIQNMTGQADVSASLPSASTPSGSPSRRFDELTAPLMAKIKSNSTESRTLATLATLATLRDTLLPKLLSGEVTLTRRQPD